MKTTSKILIIGTILFSSNLLAYDNKELENVENEVNKYISEKCLEKHTNYTSEKYLKCFINTKVLFNTKVLNKSNNKN